MVRLHYLGGLERLYHLCVLARRIKNDDDDDDVDDVSSRLVSSHNSFRNEPFFLGETKIAEKKILQGVPCMGTIIILIFDV